ncbi:Erg28-like protein [Cystobasidium minutum MCA 4210]|uniref:Erg28-like protein n=1 Tax=Cystobasidium minutum MCA 4210 TaxID=1397322 RepID=UPI0034CFA4B8|eukprot:jgi/Rhomi1/174583/fgenesh1_kg.8_\
MSQYLPDAKGGYLPYWQLLVASTAFWMSLQSLASSKQVKRLFTTINVTDIHARTFGIWNMTSAAVRFAAAYDISNKTVYGLAFATYAIAFVHFMSELFVFRTIKLNAAVISPMIVSTASMIWMANQAKFYL